MNYRLTWLPEVLDNFGLKYALVPGWESRGHGDMGDVMGVLCHHTAGLSKGNMPSLDTLVKGRSDLAGPLSQLGLGRDGTYYVVAAGRCWHAGSGTWQGISTGNTNFIGIEAENTGLMNDSPWPEVQLEAYRRGVAAILSHINRSETFCAGHKEYATPKGRKDDPDFDMDEFRKSVGAILRGQIPTPPGIPAVEPEAPPGGVARATLRRGAQGDLVKALQQKCGVAPSGNFDGSTEAAVRTFQRNHGLVPDGIVGPKSWAALDAG